MGERNITNKDESIINSISRTSKNRRAVRELRLQDINVVQGGADAPDAEAVGVPVPLGGFRDPGLREEHLPARVGADQL